jgi:hypothetical protein
MRIDVLLSADVWGMSLPVKSELIAGGVHCLSFPFIAVYLLDIPDQ